ncbi:MAG: hypothetical protein K5656_07405 [Lachnospiraceae bacterium]|nr:hypothetical protein [Lachnospiraceae bacterium]
MSRVYKISGIYIALLIVGLFVYANTTVAKADTYYYLNGTVAEELTGAISVYMMGSETSDYATEFNKYNTYIISSTGVTSVKEMVLNKGSLNITVYGRDMGVGNFELYYRADCSSDAFITAVTLNSFSTMKETGSYMAETSVSIPASGIYYLRFKGEYGKDYQLSVCQYDSANRLIEEDEPLLSYTNADLEPTYYQVNMLTNGYFTIKPTFYVNGIEVSDTSTTDQQYLNMCLVDESLNEMTDERVIGIGSKAFNKEQRYAVDKGTYYVKVYSDAPRVYSLNMHQYEWKKQAGKKKSKKKLVSGKWYKSYLDYDMTTSTADYFYFKLKKKSTVKLTIKGSAGSGKIRGAVTGADVAGKYNKITITSLDSSKTWKVHTKKLSKLPAGKYYFRVCKTTKTSNGYYKVKLKVS